MSNYLSVVKKLERGRELCAQCGKDITDARACIHYHKYREVDTKDKITLQICGPDGQWKDISRAPGGTKELTTLAFNMRIGMEMLMYLPYLKSLPLCDPDSTIIRRDLKMMMQFLEATHLMYREE